MESEITIRLTWNPVEILDREDFIKRLSEKLAKSAMKTK